MHDVEVRTLNSMPELTEAMEVLRSIWGFRNDEAPISAEFMRALAFAGNYVAGAFAGDRMIGASAGFLGLHDGDAHLHSHISGVVADWQGQHVGLAIKHHQRDWALARGINMIEWTFDPLVRRNAFFNLVKLGATVTGFAANFYGDMNDAINAGDPTDRAVVQWDLASPTFGHDRDGDPILEADDTGAPVADKSDAAVLRVWVPEDIVAMRRSDPGAARAWRIALRETFGAAVNDGYLATSMTRDGWYTLERP
jgi:predicted GNAT superfamily acetyltransferase